MEAVVISISLVTDILCLTGPIPLLTIRSLGGTFIDVWVRSVLHCAGYISALNGRDNFDFSFSRHHIGCGCLPSQLGVSLIHRRPAIVPKKDNQWFLSRRSMTEYVTYNTPKWCSGKTTISNLSVSHLRSNLSGLCTNTFPVHQDPGASLTHQKAPWLCHSLRPQEQQALGEKRSRYYAKK